MSVSVVSMFFLLGGTPAAIAGNGIDLPFGGGGLGHVSL